MPIPIRSLSREEAAAIIIKRMRIFGTLVGGVMGFLWVVVSAFALQNFPPFGDPVFFLFLFLAVLLLGAGGWLLGGRIGRGIVRGKGEGKREKGTG